MRKSGHRRHWPGWLVYLLLPLLHFASVKLTFFCAVTPENEVVVWLPNAVLLAALLRLRGRRGWLLALLTFGSDVLACVGTFSLDVAVLLSLTNLFEVTACYLLMRRAGASPSLERIHDFGTFIVIGPLLSAFVSGLLGAFVLKTMTVTAAPYVTLARLWWFGDALGMLIYTPLLLAFTQRDRELLSLRRIDGLAMLFALALAWLIFTTHGGEIGGVSMTPTLLLPAVLYIAVRFGFRWTTLAVASISLATALMLTAGHKPFGDVGVHLEIVRAQEFILTLCIVGIGFGILLSELNLRERELEGRVRERTHGLEQSNNKLTALSMTDGLTGIANRRRFDEVLAGEWRRARRSGQPLALAMLDVDLFKQFNDQYGHQAGDECLRHVARVLAANARRTGDFVARYGGEEFAFIAPATNGPNAASLAETICRALEQLALPHALSPFGVVTASLGVAVLVPVHGQNMETLVKMADDALYQAKQAGRNRVLQAPGPA